jgi:hypothetical protein
VTASSAVTAANSLFTVTATGAATDTYTQTTGAAFTANPNSASDGIKYTGASGSATTTGVVYLYFTPSTTTGTVISVTAPSGVTWPAWSSTAYVAKIGSTACTTTAATITSSITVALTHGCTLVVGSQMNITVSGVTWTSTPSAAFTTFGTTTTAGYDVYSTVTPSNVNGSALLTPAALLLLLALLVQML